jgi:hypothetical protein
MLSLTPVDRGNPIDLAAVKKIILKGIFDKEGGLIWNGLICLQLGTGGGFLKMWH